MRKCKIVNKRYPHLVRITRTIIGKGDEDNPFAEADASAEDTVIILYEGEGRSYTNTRTDGNKTVDVNRREASIPVRFDEWEAGMFPLDGDTIEVTMGQNKEVGIVNDCEGDNNRSVVYWSFRRV